MDSKAGLVRIGTSGWHYEHWIGRFYPAAFPKAEFLSYYARSFSTVEINRSFYRLPAKAAFAAWARTVPEGFVFACKASRYMTHMKKLKDPAEPVARFFAEAAGLGDKLGPVLFQLPPRFRANPERLGAFLAALPEGGRFAFEFRDESWFDDRIYDILAGHGAAFCIYDLAGREAPCETTAGFVYLRLHGPGGAYEGSYDAAALAVWASRIGTWRAAGRDVYCYFDNDQMGYAPRDALRLEALCAGEVGEERVSGGGLS